MSEPSDICMVFDDHGNAFHAFDYTPEALEHEAEVLRRHTEITVTVTIHPSPFLVIFPTASLAKRVSA
jgi:hypothetical protein